LRKLKKRRATKTDQWKRENTTKNINMHSARLCIVVILVKEICHGED